MVSSEFIAPWAEAGNFAWPIKETRQNLSPLWHVSALSNPIRARSVSDGSMTRKVKKNEKHTSREKARLDSLVAFLSKMNFQLFRRESEEGIS